MDDTIHNGDVFMMRTLLRSLLIFFITLAALIAFMLTPTGLRFDLAITSKLLPGDLTYQSVSGVLIGPITVNQIHYQNDKEIITIQQLHVNWLPTALLKKQLHISSLQINNVHFIDKNNTPYQWNFVTLRKNLEEELEIIDDITTFLHLHINHAVIKDINYGDQNQPSALHINELYLHSLPSKTKWDTAFVATIIKPQPLTLTMQLHGDPNHYALQFLIHGKNTLWSLNGIGDQQTLSLDTQHTQLLNGTLDAHLHFVWQNKIQWNGSIASNNIDLSQINPDWSNKIRSIKIALTGQAKKQTLTAQMKWNQSIFNLHLNGQLNADNQWVGLLDQLNFSIPNTTAWRLQKPATLTLTDNVFSITPLCLQSPHTGLTCFQGKWTKGKIDIAANLDVNNFKWLSAWTRFIRISQGKFDANIRIDGDITKPNLSGTLNLNNSSIVFPRLNVTLSDVSASLTGDNRVLNFTAQARSQHQPLIAKGAIDLTSPDFLAKINITSNNAPIINTDEYNATATSNLDVAIKNKNIDITGKLTIPKATLKSNDYQTTTTLPNSDIVYIGNVAPPPKPFWNVNTDIMITLGNDVSIDNIAGFSAKLGGNLRLLQTNNGDLTGTGRIFGRSGQFVIYGQALTITPDSYVEYANSPLVNPDLNLKATKQIQSISHMGSEYMQNDLVVGIQLRGTVNSPKIVFFSNRGSLSQADILSYILLGYGSSSSIPGNNDLLLRALSAVKLTSQGLLGKENLATQIQSGLGLSELGVESETTVDSQGNTLDRQSAFVVGKNLTRKFYARYSIGILDPVNVFELRYMIDKQWAVQVDSSTLGNGADVLYTISKD